MLTAPAEKPSDASAKTIAWYSSLSVATWTSYSGLKSSCASYRGGAAGRRRIRVGSWNLRHINLENGASAFLPGTHPAEDFAILTATFAKAVRVSNLDYNPPNERRHGVREGRRASNAVAPRA
jgi:hypothetical protein